MLLQAEEGDNDAVWLAKIQDCVEPQRIRAEAERLREERLLLEVKNKHVEDLSFHGECYKIW